MSTSAATRGCPIEIRVGIPRPGGALASAARALGYKVMVSANSFLVRDPDGEPVRVRRPGPAFADLDAALDSGGFVGMSHYSELPFPSTKAYVSRVVAAYPWAWYAQPDYCCEPKIASSRADIRLRQAASVALFLQCAAIAANAGLPAPVAVLQGWTPDDYHRSWEMLPLGCAPLLVGVGSVCARPVHGRAGLMAVVHRLDRVLPPGVRLHLFGVKSTGIRAIVSEAALDGRVRSVDSMAWDFTARVRYRTGRTMARRVSVMRAWHDRQVALAAGAAAAAQTSLLDPVGGGSDAPLPDLPEMDWIVDLLAAGELDLGTAARLYEEVSLEGGSSPILSLCARRPEPKATALQAELALAA
jgi:hypothetical protein